METFDMRKTVESLVGWTEQIWAEEPARRLFIQQASIQFILVDVKCYELKNKME